MVIKYKMIVLFGELNDYEVKTECARLNMENARYGN